MRSFCGSRRRLVFRALGARPCHCTRWNYVWWSQFSQDFSACFIYLLFYLFIYLPFFSKLRCRWREMERRHESQDSLQVSCNSITSITDGVQPLAAECLNNCLHTNRNENTVQFPLLTDSLNRLPVCSLSTAAVIRVVTQREKRLRRRPG